MTTSPRPLGIIAWLTWIALGGLAAIAAVGTIGAFGIAASLAEFLPVLAPTQYHLGAVGMAFGACVLVVLTAAGVLVGYIRADRIFHPSALRWVDVLVGAVAAGNILIVVALFFIPGPPQLFILVEAGVVAALAVTLVLVVMRALLRRAIAMQLELEVVV